MSYSITHYADLGGADAPALLTIAEEVGALLLVHEQRVTCAESCTGGGIARAITAVAGSSAWFDMSWVTYSNKAKTQLLGVPAALLEAHGAVSQPVAEAMAQSARQLAHADWAMAVSGVAGPSGGTADKPVGTVWIAWAGPQGCLLSERFYWPTDRATVRAQTVYCALARLKKLLAS